MKQIRSNTFETNSSSVHTLSIDASGREPSKFRLNKDGAIKVDFGQFDSNFEIFNTQYDKLSYLMTCLYYIVGYPDDIEDIYASYEFKQIRDVVCEYAGANDIVILNKEEPYIDHQSVPYNYIEIIDIYDDDAIIDFIFNKYISLKTYSD